MRAKGIARLVNISVQAASVCGLAMFAGCVLMVASTLVPYWSDLTPTAFLTAFGRFNILIPQTLGVILFPTLACLLGSLATTWRNRRQRQLWAAAASSFFLMLALTAIYFLPLNSSFVEQTLSARQLSENLRSWGNVHWLRVALSLLAALTAAFALADGATEH